jgi:ribose transport system permease protein
MTDTAIPKEGHASIRERLAEVDQAMLILLLTVALAAFGWLTTPGFLSLGNLNIILLFSTAVGIVAVAEAFVVLGKGVDLSVGAMAIVSAQITLELMDRGFSEMSAVLVVVGVALLLGVVNGWLVAVVGVPALFVTLGTGQLLLGGVQVWLLQRSQYPVPGDAGLRALVARGEIFGIRAPFIIAGAVFLLAWFIWSRTSYGRLIRSMGDNYETARSMGAPVRPVQASTYVLAALLSTLAGYMIVAREGSVVTTGSAFSPLLFTALTAIVIGGVSLSGGRGTILGVLVGTLFISLINNLLTLNNLSTASQDFARGLALLAAIALDAWLHPRDEETARSGDL